MLALKTLLKMPVVVDSRIHNLALRALPENLSSGESQFRRNSVLVKGLDSIAQYYPKHWGVEQ